MKLFVTGIGTGIGKTLVSAILTEALQADYWKPVQSGDLDDTDSHKVKKLLSNSQSVIHKEAYRLTQPLSPHAAAAIDGIRIELHKIETPDYHQHLVIEGAGGILVPLNDTDTMADLIARTGAEVVLVSSHYLGSINHTLMSWEVLRSRNIGIKGIVFNGTPNPGTEEIILKKTGLKVILRLPSLDTIDANTILSLAQNCNF